MPVERREIVVIGAGPAGSVTAREAALRGTSPLLIEQDRLPGAGNACGGVTAYAFCNRLQLSPDIVECRIRRTIFRIDATTTKFEANRPCFISFRRACFDAFLAQRAVEAGAELLTGTRVTHVDSTSRRVRLRDRKTGREREVAADIIIFADGPRTLAWNAFGIGHRPGPRTRHGLYVELEHPYSDSETMEITVDTSAPSPGYFWIFPKRDSVQVGVGAARHVNMLSLQSRLARFIEGRADLCRRRIIGRNAGIAPGELSRNLVTDGATVVGDAAGLVSAVGGGGLSFALLSGRIAGRVAAAAAKRHRTDRRMLQRYARRLRHTPQYVWLRAMARWRQSLDGRRQEERPAAYAATLKSYFGFLYLMRPPLNLLLR